MIVGLMVTDGGPHPPEKLAGATVQRFLDDFQSNAPAAIYAEVMGFRDDLDKLLTNAHRAVQDIERTNLKEDGPEHLLSAPDAGDTVEVVVDKVMALGARRKSLEEYFKRPETRQYFVEVLTSEFHHNMMIERSWCADANPKHPAAKAFRQYQSDGHSLLLKEDKDLKGIGGRETVSTVIGHFTPRVK